MPFAVTISPELSVRRSSAAVEFYKAAFGAVEIYRVENDAGQVVSQLSVDGAEFWVSEEAPANGNLSPEAAGGGTVRMLLQVDDPAAAVDRAVAAGAGLRRPVSEEHGWRLGEIIDPYGHHWEIGRPLGPWPPAPGDRLAGHVLAAVETVLVVDWPSRDVPETLVRGGFGVVVRGGPGPQDWSVWELEGDTVVTRPLAVRSIAVDVVYSFRPLGELPGIIETARALGARAVWTQSGLRDGGGERDPEGCWLADEDLTAARQMVEAAGLVHVHQPYIGAAVRRLRPDRFTPGG
ncbi:MAG TPA: VOC family protein [Acidimicrobiales bacterium]|jgi:PhnB protein|nr:VOC family protein [Acidimicrobiales bacterium]